MNTVALTTPEVFAPLTVRQDEIVQLWAEQRTRGHLDELGLDYSDLAWDTIDKFDAWSRSQIMDEIRTEQIGFSLWNGLHLHTIQHGVETYYTCVRCYGN